MKDIMSKKSLNEVLPQEKISVDLFAPDISPYEEAAFKSAFSTALTKAQMKEIAEPSTSYPQVKHVLATHWHPEWIPMKLIKKRVAASFPKLKDALIIPTQHNQLLSYDDKYSGVEVDCYSPEFDQKVQLLIHCHNKQLKKAGMFKEMIKHTFSYRSSQLFELIDSMAEKKYLHRVEEAAKRTGVSETIIKFVKIQSKKFKHLFYQFESDINPLMYKNKLLRNYLDQLCPYTTAETIRHAQILVREVKAIVKAHFDMSYFYHTRDIIAEARSFNAGIVVPHPEQFWPVLLADYDIDGIEVWNPQSHQFTKFLIESLHRQNKTRKKNGRDLLVFMGDDCHLGEKTREPQLRDPEKSGRQIGYQPAWDDMEIRKSLILGHFSRKSVIKEYRSRLS